MKRFQDNSKSPNTYIMATRVVKFSRGGTKLERFLPKNQHTQRKFLNFENWTNSEPQYLAEFLKLIILIFQVKKLNN